ALGAPSARAATISVSTTEQLAAAFVTANSGDVIELAAGNYAPSAPLRLSGVTNVTLSGPSSGTDEAVILGGLDTSGTRDLIDVDSNASLTIRNVSLRGADSAASGAVVALPGASVTLEKSDIQANNTSAVVANGGATVTVTNSTLAFNTF